MAIRRTYVGTLCALVGALALLAGGGSVADAVTGTTLVTIQTKPSPPVSLGGTISDSAQIIGGSGLGAAPSGSVTFQLYGPNDATCATAPAFTSTKPAVGLPGGLGVASANSAPFTPTVSGTYRWVASYPGDMTYRATRTNCGDEQVVVTDVTPKLTTTASPSVAAGAGTVTDTAALSAGMNPTGSITFLLFPPNDPTCTGKVVDVKATVPVSDPNSTVSPPFTPTVAGTYHWVAIYSGDTHNGAVTGACADPGESVVVTPGAATGPNGSGSSSPGSGAAGPSGPCDPVATAKAVLAGIAASLAGRPAGAFKNSCSAGLRIVLRAKEIRPGNPGLPRHDGYTTIANDLTHIAPGGTPLAFSLNSAGLALRDYALSHRRSLFAFLIVHVRQDKKTTSTEALQILTLG
jgi:hypothetical protein